MHVHAWGGSPPPKLCIEAKCMRILGLASVFVYACACCVCAVLAEFRIQAFLHVGRNLHVHAMARCGFCSHKLIPLQGRHFLRLRPCHGLVWQAGSCRLIEIHDGLYVPYDVSSMYWTPLDPNVAAEPPITCFFVVRRCAACARHHARLTLHRRDYMRRVRRHTRVSN